MSCSNAMNSEELRTLNALKPPITVVSYTCINGWTDDYALTLRDASGRFYIFESREIARAIITYHKPGDTLGKPTKKRE